MNQFPSLTSRIQGLSSQSWPCWASQLSGTSPSVQKVLLCSAYLDTHGFWNYCGEIAGVQKSGESCFPLPLAPSLHRNWDPYTSLSVCPASQSKKQTQFNTSSQMPTRGHSHTPETLEELCKDQDILASSAEPEVTNAWKAKIYMTESMWTLPFPLVKLFIIGGNFPSWSSWISAQYEFGEYVESLS